MQPANPSQLERKSNQSFENEPVSGHLQGRICQLKKSNEQLDKTCCHLAHEYLSRQHPQKDKLSQQMLEFLAKKFIYFKLKLPEIKEQSEEDHETKLRDEIAQLENVNQHLSTQEKMLTETLRPYHMLESIIAFCEDGLKRCGRSLAENEKN